MRDEVLAEHQKKVDKIGAELIRLYRHRVAVDELIEHLAGSLGYELGFFHGFHGLDHNNEHAKLIASEQMRQAVAL